MNRTEFIIAFEEKSQLVDHGLKFVNEQLELERKMKESFRVIREADWQELKEKVLLGDGA